MRLNGQAINIPKAKAIALAQGLVVDRYTAVNYKCVYTIARLVYYIRRFESVLKFTEAKP